MHEIREQFIENVPDTCASNKKAEPKNELT